jgi:uncharacterized protein (TIGR00369 family)
MTQNPTPQELIEQLGQMLPAESGIQIPPPIFKDMQAEIVEFDGERLKVKFPVLERYQNPLGHMQGGMIVTAIDNTIGPLSYLLAPPSATTQLNTSYLRPITAEEDFIFVEARLTARTRRQLFLEATVTNAQGKVVALTQATQFLVGQ